MKFRDRFTINFEKLPYSTLPVAWLRIKLLCEYLSQSGLEENAHKLEIEWRSLADALSIKEDYYGFYSDEFLIPILNTINDMLTETEPHKFESNGITGVKFENQNISPIKLLNIAWLKFYENPTAYQ